MIRRYRAILLMLAVWIGTSAVLAYAVTATHPPAGANPDNGKLPFKLTDRIASIEIERTEDGPRVLVPGADGPRHATGDELLEMLAAEQRRLEAQGFLFRLLNITTWTGVFWVLLGLTGQILFTGRMVVQWILSERARASVVPTAFWWMSLAGATMLVIYFVWRKDIVGVLGQSTGWVIYMRNLWLIHFSPPAPPDDDATPPEDDNLDQTPAAAP